MYLNDTWDSRWLEIEKGQWIQEIFSNLQSRKQADHDSTPETLHFLTGYGSFAAKLAHDFKDINECSCGKEQVTKHLWE